MYVRRRFAASILLINATHSMSQLVSTVNQILVVAKTLSCQGLVSEDSQVHAALSSFLDPPLRTWGAASRVSMFQTPAQILLGTQVVSPPCRNLFFICLNGGCVTSNQRDVHDQEAKHT
jgi:hypothetical protein